MREYLSDIASFLNKYPYSKTIMLTLLLFLFLLVIKKLIIFNLSRKETEKIEKLFIQRKVSQYLNYLFLLFLFALWFSQLQVVFVSLIAVAAAFVIAFKELIMCITGWLYLRNSALFKEGQRIEIADVRGFVIEKQLLTTKVLEIGPENNSQQTTGDVIAIPNSLFITNTLKNESYFRGYSIKSYQFKLNITDDVEGLEKELLERSKEICKDYIEIAEKSISSFCEKEAIVIPSVEPRTKIVFENSDKVIIIVKLPVKNTQIADTEQNLNRLVLNWRRRQLSATK